VEIDDDTTSNAILKSHNQFIVSVLICMGMLVNYTNYTRALVIEALSNLIEIPGNDEIRQAAASSLGYICDRGTYKILFKKLQMTVETESNKSNYTDSVVCALISSYCHCIAIRNIHFNEKDIDLFRQLLKNCSENVFKAARTGLGRVLKDKSLLFEILGSNYIQCYHALIDATAYTLLYEIWQSSIDAVVDFIEQHPDLLSIFIVEFYHSIRHFTNDVFHFQTPDYYSVYGHRRYVEAAGLLAVRIPAAFCAFIKDWHDGNNLKRALFYTSKQHNFPQRAACLTILSIFGELTVELCEMIIEALRDDPHIQNTCYRCLTRINSVKDEKIVFNLLFSYLKSKSMNVRYVAAKIFLHLSQSSLIPSKQVQTVLNDLMLDPDSNRDLWLIEEQDNIVAESVYYYVGPLKDVVYSLLVRHVTGDQSVVIRRNELNDIDANFIESEKAARLASCSYETETEGN